MIVAYFSERLFRLSISILLNSVAFHKESLSKIRINTISGYKQGSNIKVKPFEDFFQSVAVLTIVISIVFISKLKVSSRST